jgi:hypothetical protein
MKPRWNGDNAQRSQTGSVSPLLQCRLLHALRYFRDTLTCKHCQDAFPYRYPACVHGARALARAIGKTHDTSVGEILAINRLDDVKERYVFRSSGQRKAAQRAFLRYHQAFMHKVLQYFCKKVVRNIQKLCDLFDGGHRPRRFQGKIAYGLQGVLTLSAKENAHIYIYFRVFSLKLKGKNDIVKFFSEGI